MSQQTHEVAVDLRKQRFRQTDVGQIPADWQSPELGNVIQFIGGSQPDKSHFRQSGKPGYVRLIQIRDYKSDRHLTFVPEKLARRFCDKRDIMIGRYGPPIFQILRGIEGAYNVALIKAVPSERIDRDYAYYYLCQDTLFAFVEKLSQRSSGQTGVDLNQLKSYPFVSPPTLAEQEAIASALSDADALIESLEQLLAKKRLIKQGAMQELLTGDWPSKAFGDLFKFSGGFSASRNDLGSDGHLYLHYGDIHGSDRTFVDVEADGGDIPRIDIPLSEVSPASLLDDGDVVFVDASEDVDGTNKHVVIDNPIGQPFISGLHTIVAKRKTNEIDPRYMRYCFQTTEIKEQFRFYAVGTKVSGVSKTSIAKIMLSVPSPEDQSEIAATLDAMEQEIDLIVHRLAKAQQIKQAMLQQLLTGTIRLV